MFVAQSVFSCPVQENSRLEDELTAVKLQLTEAEGSVNKLQRDLDQLLHDKVTRHATPRHATGPNIKPP